MPNSTETSSKNAVVGDLQNALQNSSPESAADTLMGMLMQDVNSPGDRGSVMADLVQRVETDYSAYQMQRLHRALVILLKRARATAEDSEATGYLPGLLFVVYAAGPYSDLRLHRQFVQVLEELLGTAVRSGNHRATNLILTFLVGMGFRVRDELVRSGADLVGLAAWPHAMTLLVCNDPVEALRWFFVRRSGVLRTLNYPARISTMKFVLRTLRQSPGPGWLPLTGLDGTAWISTRLTPAIATISSEHPDLAKELSDLVRAELSGDALAMSPARPGVFQPRPPRLRETVIELSSPAKQRQAAEDVRRLSEVV